MGNYILIGAACIVLFAVAGFLLIRRSSLRLSPSKYWINRNQHDDKHNQLLQQIRKEETDFRTVKQIINNTVQLRNTLKRIGLETEAIQMLAGKTKHIAHSEYDELLQLENDLHTLRDAFPNPKTDSHGNTPPNMHQIQDVLIATERCLNEVIGREKFSSPAPEAIKQQKEALEIHYHKVVAIHKELIEFYHEKLSVSL